VAEVLEDLATLSSYQGDYPKAYAQAQRAVAIIEKGGNPNDPAFAQALDTEATELRSLGRYAEAVPLWRRAIAIGEQSLTADDPKLAWYRNNLGNLIPYPEYERASAVPQARRAWCVPLGPEHPDVASRRCRGMLAGRGRDSSRPGCSTERRQPR
jgi:tetratricopeptide (TPR) repeat protein